MKMPSTYIMKRLKYIADVYWKKEKHSGAREKAELAAHKTNGMSQGDVGEL